MFYVLVRKKYKINPETIWVIYDVDDICWDFAGRLCKRIGADYQAWTSFYVTENEHFSSALVKQACELLIDETLFHNIEFYDGIEDVMKPAYDLGVNVEFNSNAPVQGMIDLKREQLKAAIPGLKDKNMTFNLIIPNQPSAKQLHDNTIIFVDDNPYHIVGSTAKINVMKRCPWNTSKEGCNTLGDMYVTKLDNLLQINSFVYQRLKFYLEYGC